METKKTYAPHELQPSTPIHPGEILKDELESRGMSQRKLRLLPVSISYSVLNEVINGKRPVTTECTDGRVGSNLLEYLLI